MPGQSVDAGARGRRKPVPARPHVARVVENVTGCRVSRRAENTARIIGVNTNLLLDLPGGIAPGWLPLVDISGNRAEFDAQYKEKGHAARNATSCSS